MFRFRSHCFLFFIYSVLCANAIAFPRLQEKQALSVVDAVNYHFFPQAIEESRQLLKKHEGSPEAYVLHSFVLLNYMNAYKTFKYKEEFLELYPKAIDLTQGLLKKYPEDPYLHFCLGALYGYRGMLFVKEGRLMKALGLSRGIVGHLRKSIEYGPVYDAYYGLSQYHYYKSYFSRFFRWIPGVKDDRSIGYKYLDIAKEKGAYMKYEAALSWYTMKILDEETTGIERRLKEEKEKNQNSVFLHHKFLSLYKEDEEWAKIGLYCEDALRVYDENPHTGMSAYLMIYYYMTIAHYEMGAMKKAQEALGQFESAEKKLYGWSEDRDYLKDIRRYKSRLSKLSSLD